MRIGWIGLGKLGLPMARRVREAGFEMELFDLITPPDTIVGGARVRHSLTEVARSSDILITSLPDDAAFGAVIAEALPQMRVGSVLVDTSTISPQACDETRDLAGRIGYLAAPVSGSTDLAVRGELTLFCSGSESARRTAEPVLASFASRIFNVGERAEARYLKLALNHFIGTTTQVAAEALTLARRGGVAWPILLDVLEQSAAASPFIRHKIAALRHRDFAPAFTITQMLKDMTLIVEAGTHCGVNVGLAKVVVEAFQCQAEEGLANQDLFAALLSAERAAGLGEP